MDLVIGHLQQINASYMVSPEFLAQYTIQGETYLKSKEFKDKYGIHYKQAKYDREFLYGVLRMVTRAGGAGRKHVHTHKQTNDGFATWKDMLEDCQHDGSKRVKIEKLKKYISIPYTKKYSGGLITYIERFQTSIEELGTLLDMYSSDTNKLEFLQTALNSERTETGYYLDHIKDKELTFRQACSYIRERALMDYTFDSTPAKKFHKLESEPSQEDSFNQILTTMRNWASETGNDIHHVYAAMNASSHLRESLMIPTKLWIKLSPDIKKAIMETRRTIENSSDTNRSKNTAPRQYSNPAKANSVLTEELSETEDEEEITEHRASHMRLSEYGLLYEDSSDNDSTESEDTRQLNMAKAEVTFHHKIPLDVSANSAMSTSPIAYADGGADSCIGGEGWKVQAYTGRKVIW